MNILLVTSMFPPIRTGTSFYAKNVANILFERGHQVTVVTLNVDGKVEDVEYPFPVHRLSSIHFPIRNFFKHFRIASCIPTNYKKICSIARQSSAGVILLINHYQDIAFPAIVAARNCRIPLVCSVGTQIQSDNVFRDRILNFFDRLICGNLIFPFCTKVIAWDKQILQYLEDVHGSRVVEKTEIINYGVNGNPAEFEQYYHDYTLRDQIIGVGAIIKQRNFVNLVKAFASVSDEYPNLRLKIIGHVYYEAAMKAAEKLEIGDRVEFTGELPHDQVMNELKLSDLIYSSLTGKYVGLGTATIEAMLMGVPVIANVPPDLLGTARLEDMEDYAYADSSSIDQIESKIKGLISDETLRGKIGENGRRFVVEHMNWDLVGKEMEKLMCNIVEEKK